MVGLFAFFYGDPPLPHLRRPRPPVRLRRALDDIVKRPYITAGFTAFVLMMPLAVTSTTGSIRRMGGKRWQPLHRLVYVTAGAAVLHYFWKVKPVTTAPIYYGLAVAGVLAARAWRAARKPGRS